MMSTAHDRAQGYWRKASDTFIADSSYYRSVRSVLERDVIPQVPDAARVLDIGCGAGTYTELFAQAAERIDAFDLSRDLIDVARQRGLTNVHFEVGDAAELRPGRYELVACMGVLVCL